MTTTLITGGNRSLGYTAAKRLIEAGHDVWIGARDAERGAQAAEELGARHVQLDVDDNASVAAAAATIDAAGGLDVLVNNAGILGATTPPAETTADDLRAAFETNVLGIVRTTHAFLPLLERSAAPAIVNVASGLGSMSFVIDPDRVESTVNVLPYTASKAAAVMLTLQYAKALPAIRVNVVDPGYTATDFNGHAGPQTVEEGTDQIVAMAQVGPDGPTGTFTDRHGTVPW